MLDKMEYIIKSLNIMVFIRKVVDKNDLFKIVLIDSFELVESFLNFVFERFFLK